MKLPRVSIATLMGAVVILSIDIGLLREGFRDERAIFFILGIAPMTNLVLAAAIAEAVRLGRTGTGRPFWTGFAIFGGVAMLATSGYVFLSVAEPTWIVLRALWVVLGKATFDRLIVPGVDLIIVALAYTLPQLAFAVLGGWLFRRYRLAIVRLEGDTLEPSRGDAC